MDLGLHIHRGAVILLEETQKGLKQVTGKKVLRKTGTGKNRKTGKNICAGNQKMPFLSHGNPENMVETGKHSPKFAENRKVFLEAA